jgi:hypothetical protein
MVRANPRIALRDIIDVVLSEGGITCNKTQIHTAKCILKKYGTSSDVDWTVARINELQVGTFPLINQMSVALVGASVATFEKLVGPLIQCGAYERAQQAAFSAGRSLTRQISKKAGLWRYTTSAMTRLVSKHLRMQLSGESVSTYPFNQNAAQSVRHFNTSTATLLSGTSVKMLVVTHSNVPCCMHHIKAMLWW